MSVEDGKHADGQTSYLFVFSVFYLSVYPLLQDHLILGSHTLQVHKPLFFFQSIYLTEEPFDFGCCHFIYPFHTEIKEKNVILHPCKV